MANLEIEIRFPPFLSGKGAPRLFQGLDKPALQDIFTHSVVKEYEGEKIAGSAR